MCMMGLHVHGGFAHAWWVCTCMVGLHMHCAFMVCTCIVSTCVVCLHVHGGLPMHGGFAQVSFANAWIFLNLHGGHMYGLHMQVVFALTWHVVPPLVVHTPYICPCVFVCMVW
jgi:hypothetical protein